MAYDMVGVQVYHHARKEYQSSEKELNTVKPRISIRVGRRDVKQPTSYQICIDYIENASHHYYRQRHPALSLDKEREYEGTLKIMEHEERGHGYQRRLTPSAGTGPEDSHTYENGRFHQDPTKAVAQRRPPFRSIENAVARRYEA